MVTYEIRLRRRRPWLRRLFSLLPWAGAIGVLALAFPTPLGPAHLGLAAACGILTTAALLKRRNDTYSPDRLGPSYHRRRRGRHRAPTIDQRSAPASRSEGHP